MNVERTRLEGVLIVEPTVYADARGYFMETWNAKRFDAAGLPTLFVQDNQSYSHAGVLRGLHYQTELPQGKLVRVILGEVFDVAVDLRRDSPTVGQWIGVHLSAANRRQLWIPPGFAHGFYVVGDGPAEVAYKVTQQYSPAHERTLLWHDPHVAIQWPLTANGSPVVSPKDAAGDEFGAAALYDSMVPR